MPGPAFHLEVLRLAIQTLAGGSAADKAKAKVMTDNPAYAQLGAFGPDILRYKPVPTEALDTLVKTKDLTTLKPADLLKLGLQVAPNPEMALYGVLYRVLVPHYPEFQAIDDFLAKMAGIAAAEDVDGLKNAKADFDAVKPKLDALKGLTDDATAITNAGLGAVVVGKPAIEGKAPALTKSWRTFEFVRWKRTATFGRDLVKQATAANDKQLLAYAYGYLSHMAAAVVGEPFVNAITGGPYRTHWWRNKWVRNHVDAWTFGRYRTPGSMAGDVPSPDYSAWKSLCGTNLQDGCKVDPGLTGPAAATAVQSGAIPATPGFDKIAAALVAATQHSFGAGSGVGPAIAHPQDLDDPAAVRGAYVGAISVLWFMTGNTPLCPAPPGVPPKGAETPPSWFGTGGTPPSPATGSGGGATASGIIALILAVIAIITGWFPAAVAAIILAIAAATAGDPVDWDSLRGTIYWLQVSMFQVENGLHKALVAGGVAYPLGRELGTPPSGVFPWVPVMDQTAVPLTKDRRVSDYPLRMDDRVVNGKDVPADAFFVQSPASAGEAPSTRPAMDFYVYADLIVDGKGILNGGVMTDTGAFPTRDVDFGGAVANAADVIRTEAAALANYNLDGDRGYGWKTWKPKLFTQPADPGAVDFVPEP